MSSKQLKPNPFTTYRDPATGRWIVIQSAPQPFTSSIGLSIASPPIEALELCCV